MLKPDFRSNSAWAEWHNAGRACAARGGDINAEAHVFAFGEARILTTSWIGTWRSDRPAPV